MHKSTITPSTNREHTPMKRVREDLEELLSSKKKVSPSTPRNFMNRFEDGENNVNSRLSELKQLYGNQYKTFDRDTGTESNDSTNELSYKRRVGGGDDLTSETQQSHLDFSKRKMALPEDNTESIARENQQLQKENQQLQKTILHLRNELSKCNEEKNILTDELEKTAAHSNKLEVEIRKFRRQSMTQANQAIILDDYRALEQELQSKSNQCEESLDKIEELNAQVQSLKKALYQRDISLQQRADDNDKENDAPKVSDENEKMAQMLKEATEKIESLHLQNQEKNQLLEEQERNINNYRAQIESLEVRRRSHLSRGSEINSSTDNNEELYTRLNNTKLSLSKELYDTATALNHLASDVAKKEDEIRRLESQRTDTRSRLHDALEYQQALEHKVQEFETLLRQKENTQSEYNKLQEAYTQANQRIQDLQFELKDKDDQYYQEQQITVNKIQKLEARNQTLKEKVIHTENKLNDNNEEYNKMEQSLMDLQQYLETLKKDMKKKETELRETRTEMQTRQHETTQLQSDLEYIQEKLDEQHQLNRSLEQQVQRMSNAENQIQERAERISQLENTVNLIRKDLNDAIRVKVETEEKYKNLELDLSELTAELQDKQNKWTALERENQKLERKNAEFERKILFVQELLRKAMEDKEKRG